MSASVTIPIALVRKWAADLRLERPTHWLAFLLEDAADTMEARSLDSAEGDMAPSPAPMDVQPGAFDPKPWGVPHPHPEQAWRAMADLATKAGVLRPVVLPSAAFASAEDAAPICSIGDCREPAGHRHAPHDDNPTTLNGVGSM